MFSRQNLRLVCVAGSQIGDSQSRRLWIDCPPNYLRCCICNLASLAPIKGHSFTEDSPVVAAGKALTVAHHFYIYTGHFPIF